MALPGRAACSNQGTVTVDIGRQLFIQRLLIFFTLLLIFIIHFIIHPVVLVCLFVMYKSLVRVTLNKSLTFKIKLQQVLSVAKLLIDNSVSLIILREHPKWVYSAKSNWKCWLSTSKFILTCRKFGNPQISYPSQNTGLWELLNDFLLRFLVAKGSSGLSTYLLNQELGAVTLKGRDLWIWGKFQCRG